MPDESLSLCADYRSTSGALEGPRLGAGVRDKGETFGDSANSFEVDGETLWDGGVDYASNDL